MADPADRPPQPPGSAADNPFAAPQATLGPGGGADGDVGPGGHLVRHVQPVAILMLVQGAFELLLGVLVLAVAVMAPLVLEDLPELGRPGPPTPSMRTIIMVTYGVMGGCGLVAGVLHVVGGIFGLRFRRRMLGIVALAVGMVSIFTCYCAPTSIALAIYGLITYGNPAVVAAFTLGEAGVPAAEIRARLGG